MLKEKKIILLSPTIEDGGVEKNLYNISNYLVKKFDKIYLISANKDKLHNFSNKIDFKFPKTNYFINSSRLIKSLICFFLLLKLGTRQKNSIILSFNNNILNIFFAKLIGAKIIIRSNTSLKSYIKSNLKKKIFNFIFNLADKVIVNSESMMKEMKIYFNINAKCIYNPLENNDFIVKKSNETINPPVYFKNTLNILSIGRLVKQKNHILLLKALNKIKNKINFKLIIIGDGEEKKKLMNYISKNNLQKKIHIFAFKENIYPYLKSSDLFVSTSNYEGLPNVLLEALSLKKIIFSTDCPTGPKEILNYGKFGSLYPVNGIEDLSKLILNYSINKKEYEKMAVDGFNSLQKYNFDINCEKYFEVIDSFI